MKNLKLGTKIIGMVSAILILMVVSSGFGIIKINNIGGELEAIAEKDIPLSGLISEIALNQLDQAVRFERALRFGEVLSAKEAAQKGLKRAEKEFDELTRLVEEELKKGEEIAEHAVRTAKTAEARRGFEEIAQRLKSIENEHSDYESHVHHVFALIHEGKLHGADEVAEKVEKEEDGLNYELQQFSKKVAKFTEESALKAEHDEQSAITGMSVISLFSVIFGLFMGILITRGITKPINRIIAGLGEGSSQVAAASAQVSLANQSLAEGSSEQAASIEETSSSMEEMSSMTKQNANHADQADTIMKTTNQIVGEANQSMSELTESMAEISKASEETQKIVKTIDEIAFQTNLLALNAAVEAARAGEAGAGFAVVADEVRNLALKAANAAKDTASLIESTVKKVRDGSELVSKTNEAFSQVSGSSSKVGELVAGIAAGSNEQAHGIEQVNKAMGEMDKVVQQNAANAEENAGASEEMSAQSEQMAGYVEELMSLVGGNGKGSGNGHSGKVIRHRMAVRNDKSFVAPSSSNLYLSANWWPGSPRARTSRPTGSNRSIKQWVKWTRSSNRMRRMQKRTPALREEMSAQSEQMAGYVEELMSLVGGNGSTSGSGNGHSGKVIRHRMAVRNDKSFVAPAVETRKKATAIHRAREIDPEQMIPQVGRTASRPRLGR